jgi:hypothetical protein
MAMADWEIAGITGPRVSLKSKHALADGNRVRIEPAVGSALVLDRAGKIVLEKAGPWKNVYAKVSGQSPIEFAAYDDAALSQPADLQGISAGAGVTRLAHEDWAVAVGIGDYSKFEVLQGPSLDAAEFCGWLVAGDGGRVPNDQVRLIRSTDYTTSADIHDARPTVSDVQNEFAWLADMAMESNYTKYYRVGRRLYIFLSGHGIFPTRTAMPNYDETGLLMANARPFAMGMHIAGRAYADWFWAIGAFDEVILLMDCCRTMENAPPMPAPFTVLQPKRKKLGRRLYIAATRLNTESWEQPFAGSPVKRGVFARALMEALTCRSLADAGGNLTDQLLISHLRLAVPRLRLGQEPVAYSPDDPTPLVIITRPQRVQPQATIQFHPMFIGATAILTGPAYPNPTQSHVITSAVWQVPLEPHLYKLEVGTATKLFEIGGAPEVQNVQFP